MSGRRFWIKAGNLERQRSEVESALAGDDYKKFAEGQLRMTTGPLGTEVKWMVDTPSTASL